jgi:hypothetical protein
VSAHGHEADGRKRGGNGYVFATASLEQRCGPTGPQGVDPKTGMPLSRRLNFMKGHDILCIGTVIPRP